MAFHSNGSEKDGIVYGVHDLCSEDCGLYPVISSHVQIFSQFIYSSLSMTSATSTPAFPLPKMRTPSHLQLFL